MEITPLYRDLGTGQIMEAKPGDVLSLPVNAIVEEFATLFQDAEVNTCCALIEYTAIPINSINLPNMNYRKSPYVDCVILESGTTGQRVKVAMTQGKLYSTGVSIPYTDSDLLYLGKDSKLTTEKPSVDSGDNYCVIVGRLVNHNEFIFDPSIPLDLNDVSGDLPSIIGNANKYLFTDGNRVEWREVTGGSPIPVFSVTSFTSSESIVEVGKNCLVVLSFAFSSNPKAVRVKDSLSQIWHTVDTPFTSYTMPDLYVLENPATISFTVEATSLTNEIATRQVSMDWFARKFWGVGLASIGNPGTFINALQGSTLSNSTPCTISLLASTDQYIYFAIPSTWSEPTFAVGGFSGGFQLVASQVDVTNQYGVTTQYDLWRSDYDNLGQTTVGIT